MALITWFGSYFLVFLMSVPYLVPSEMSDRSNCPTANTTLSSLCESLPSVQVSSSTGQSQDYRLPGATNSSDSIALTNVFGDGRDGEVVVDFLHTVVVNSYTSVKGNASEGSKSILVTSSSIFRVGGEVCVMQMKGSNAGSSMYGRVTKISKNTMVLNEGLTFNCSTHGDVNRCQVITVPHFSKVTMKDHATLTGRPWDGYVGGVIVFRANKEVHTGPYGSRISACSIGFRGGLGGKTRGLAGLQGESFDGSQSIAHTSNYDGGGGGPVCHGYGGGGAGGGHQSSGNHGTAYYRNRYGIHCTQHSAGGSSNGHSSVSESILMGSGGGGGGHGSQCCGLPGRGGSGGGIIIISTPVLVGEGLITACGTSGQAADHTFHKSGGNHGGGGGGSGGSILIITLRKSTKGLFGVRVGGGAGGQSPAGYHGGNGSGGRKTFIANIFLGSAMNSYWL